MAQFKSYNDIGVSTEGHVATIEIQRPPHNFFDYSLIQQIADAMETIDEDNNLRCVVLCAQGKSFCAGGDLDWMKKQIFSDRSTRIKEAKKLAMLLFKMYNFPKPLIAKVEGNAFGGGIGIISVCDIAVSLDNIKLALTEAKLGLIPATISPYVVLKVGSSNAIEMFTSARTFSPQEGQKIGLIKSFTTSDKIDDNITNEILPFLKNAPAALSASKKLVRNLSVKIDENTIRFTVEALADVWENPEAIEGINAFFEKRKPNWLMEK